MAFIEMDFASGGEMVKPELIWENLNPTATFSAQTINFGDEYEAYVVKTKYATTGADITAFGYNYIPIGKGTIGTNNYVGGNGHYSSSRNITANTNSVSIQDAYYNDAQLNNNRVIPLEIYGLKKALFD